MSAAIVIPARFGSSRLPGKPMLAIAGMTMLERVWRIAGAVPGVSRVVICTEDRRIAEHAAVFGGEAVLTSPTCRNGSERMAEAAASAGITETALINLQGDAVLTPPWVLAAMVAEFAGASDTAADSEPDFDIVTPAVALGKDELAAFKAHKAVAPASGTTVTFDRHRNALYFSKQIIPFVRTAGMAPVYRHIGLYGFTARSLARYVALPPSPLELTEGLEQLRALENGMTIRVVPVDYRGRTHASVDAPEDVPLVEAIIAREGELAR